MGNQRNIIIGIAVAVVVVLIIGWYMSSGKVTTASNTPAPPTPAAPAATTPATPAPTSPATPAPNK